MRHRFFTILAAVSLLLCGAACVGWVRSYWQGFEIAVVLDTASKRIFPLTESCKLRLENGSISVTIWGDCGPGHVDEFGHIPTPPTRLHDCSYQSDRHATPTLDEAKGMLGAWSRRDIPELYHTGGYTTLHAFIAPLWPVAMALALASTVLFVLRQRRTVRNVAGSCRNCGYDLRATPDRCPEPASVPALVTCPTSMTAIPLALAR